VKCNIDGFHLELHSVRLISKISLYFLSNHVQYELYVISDVTVNFVISASVDRSQKDNLKQLEAQEEQRLIRGQKEYLDLEIRKFRRKKLLIFHSLEQELLREVRISIYVQ